MTTTSQPQDVFWPVRRDAADEISRTELAANMATVPAEPSEHGVENGAIRWRCATAAMPGAIIWSLYGLFDRLYATYLRGDEMLGSGELYSLCLRAVGPLVPLEERSWYAYQLRRAVTSAYQHAGYRRHIGCYDVAALLTAIDDL